MAKKQSKRIELGGMAASGGSGSRGQDQKVGQRDGLTHNPFAALRGSLGESRAEATAVNPTASAATPSGQDARSGGLSRGAAIVVRHERKGHGGKTVTVVDLSRASGLAPETLDELARDLRKALGAGARADGDQITVQGDLVERVSRYIEVTYGARVTLGTR